MGPTWIALLLIGALAESPGRASSDTPRFEIDQNVGRVVRHDAGGKVCWSVPLHRILAGARTPPCSGTPSGSTSGTTTG